MDTTLTAPAAPAAPAAATAPSLFVGVDVSKDALDLARSDSGHVTTFANDPAGVAAVVRGLAAAAAAGPAVAVVVVEATGGLERPLVDALLDAGLPVARVHPGRVRQFARGLGVLAKTDAADARVLARFGELAAPRLAEKRSAAAEDLRALVVCRRQLVETRVQQANRLGATAGRPARKAIEAVVRTLDRQVERLDKQIRALIDADDELGRLDGLLQTVPGVGPAVSATLAAELTELGEADRRQVAALVGVAPVNRDSGRASGPRSIAGGRAAVRCALYMAAVAAIRFNPVIRAFSDRLRSAGKVGKVRVVACMRKLLTLLNAMARENLRWEQLDVVKKLPAHA